MSYTIYTQAGRKCPYCDKAAALLDERGLEYALRPLSGQELANVAHKAGMETVPIVYFGDELVGGFDRLKERLDRPAPPEEEKDDEDAEFERELAERDARQERAREALTAALDEAGIELSWGACGCCESPWVTLRIGGETILEREERFPFSNLIRDKADAA